MAMILDPGDSNLLNYMKTYASPTLGIAERAAQLMQSMSTSMLGSVNGK